MKTRHLVTTAMAAMLATAVALQANAAEQVKTNSFWWPDQLNLSPLRDHDGRSNPLGETFSYANEFSALDLAAAQARYQCCAHSNPKTGGQQTTVTMAPSLFV